MARPVNRSRIHTLALSAVIAASPAYSVAAGGDQGKIIFRAVCSDLRGHRVNMNPADPGGSERWHIEFYRSGPAPQNSLELLSDDAHLDSIRMTWGRDQRFLPIVYRSDSQISVADVDEVGVWIFTLFFQTDKVLVSRQTATRATGAVGALVVGSCEIRPD